MTYSSHDNNRFLIEALLKILNTTEDKKIMYRILQCYVDIMNYSKECVFYSNDLEAFINSSLYNLSNTYTGELRFYFLSMLQLITGFDDYYKNKYKIDELVEMLENCEHSSEVNEENKKLASSTLKNIKNHS